MKNIYFLSVSFNDSYYTVDKEEKILSIILGKNRLENQLQEKTQARKKIKV